MPKSTPHSPIIHAKFTNRVKPSTSISPMESTLITNPSINQWQMPKIVVARPAEFRPARHGQRWKGQIENGGSVATEVRALDGFISYTMDSFHTQKYTDVWFGLQFQDRDRFVQLSSNVHYRSSGTLETLKSQANKLECWMQSMKMFIKIFRWISDFHSVSPNRKLHDDYFDAVSGLTGVCRRQEHAACSIL